MQGAIQTIPTEHGVGFLRDPQGTDRRGLVNAAAGNWRSGQRLRRIDAARTGGRMNLLIKPARTLEDLARWGIRGIADWTVEAPARLQPNVEGWSRQRDHTLSAHGVGRGW
jgi:hypothetical protein